MGADFGDHNFHVKVVFKVRLISPVSRAAFSRRHPIFASPKTVSHMADRFLLGQKHFSVWKSLFDSAKNDPRRGKLILTRPKVVADMADDFLLPRKRSATWETVFYSPKSRWRRGNRFFA
jgi:hypothetical protein